MTRERWICHVTLNTGHARRSPRSEVGEDVIEAMIPLIGKALSGVRVEIPGVPRSGGYTMQGAASGRCASITVHGWRAPIAEIGVAAHSRCGAGLWRSLHSIAGGLGIDVRTKASRCPPEPWVAALLVPGAAIYDDAMHWLGDFERCVAWTWIEMIRRRR